MKYSYKLIFDQNDLQKSESVQQMRTTIQNKLSLEYYNEIEIDSSLPTEEIISHINKEAVKEEKVKIDVKGNEKTYWGLIDWLEAVLIEFELEDISSELDKRMLNGNEYISQYVVLKLIIEELELEVDYSTSDFCQV